MAEFSFDFVDRKKLNLSRDDTLDTRLWKLLNELCHSTNRFGHCVQLLEFSNYQYAEVTKQRSRELEVLSTIGSNPLDISKKYISQFEMFTSWSFAAAHEAGFLIHDAGTILNEILKIQNEEEKLNSIILSDSIERAIYKFTKSFPHWKAMRHAIAHKRELHNEVTNAYHGGLKQGPIRKPAGSGSLQITDGIQGNLLTMTRKGALISLEVSSKSDQNLLEVLKTLKKALDPILHSYPNP